MQNIQSVLELFGNRLNSFLKGSTPRTEDLVVLSNLVNPDGTQPPITADKVVLSLSNIEQTTTLSSPTQAISPGNQGTHLSPPVLTTLDLLIFANFSGERYPIGLDLISRVIGYLQDNPIFNQSNLPGLDPAIDRLSFEFVNLDASQWSHYLRMSGVTYLPAIMYKLRILPFPVTQ